jgi:hypothetical protein
MTEFGIGGQKRPYEGLGHQNISNGVTLDW